MIRLAILLIGALLKADAADAQSTSVTVPIEVTPGGTSDEEFVGPFPNWINALTGIRVDGTGGSVCAGATGNGSTDDAAALQSCLDARTTTLPVLYLPAPSVNYKINSTLKIGSAACNTSPATGSIYLSIIGADPATVTIKWGGSAGGTMLCLNGVAYSKVSRITFDGANGANSAGILIDQSFVNAGTYFDTENEYSDLVLKNATSIGFSCGQYGGGCAETSILRDYFLNNFHGISTRNQNALDMWVWYSKFENNTGYAITNKDGGGNFHAFNNVFLGSTLSDMRYNTTGLFDVRFNYSSGSNYFFYGGGTGTGNNVYFQGNTVLDATSLASGDDLTAGRGSIFTQDRGPVTLIDNIIRNSVSNTSGPVATGDNVFSIGNTFTVTPNITVSGGNSHAVDNITVSRSTVNPTQPTLPGTPPNHSRTIYEVTPGSSAATIQAAICTAATGSSGFSSGSCTGTVVASRNVVHLQAATYTINTILSVPANADIQIIGDGWNSVLSAASGAGPVLKLNGPSKVTLRSFRVYGNNLAIDGIELTNIDQIGSRVFMERPHHAFSRPGIFVDGLDRTSVEMHDLSIYNTPSGQVGLKVVGGSSASSGTWLGGMTYTYAGIYAGNDTAISLANGGHLHITNCWDESGSGEVEFANVTGIGKFTLANCIVAMGVGSTYTVNMHAFQGTAALLSFRPLNNDDVTITGDGTNGKVLAIGLAAIAPFFSNTTSPADTYEFLTGVDDPAGTASALPQINCCTDSFIRAVLSEVRAIRPSTPMSSPVGITNVNMHNMAVDTTAAAGIHLH
jgi:hypothetical protein